MDSAGGVYVADRINKRVVKLVAGVQTVVPFTGVNHPTGVAVDGAGSVCVTDWRNNQVAKQLTG